MYVRRKFFLFVDTKNRNSMDQNSTKITKEQMPGIPSPNSFCIESFDQLTNDSFNSVTLMFHPSWPKFWFTAGFPERSQQKQTTQALLFGQFRVPVVTVTQNPTLDTCDQVFRYSQFMDIGWSHLIQRTRKTPLLVIGRNDDSNYWFAQRDILHKLG